MLKEMKQYMLKICELEEIEQTIMMPELVEIYNKYKVIFSHLNKYEVIK